MNREEKLIKNINKKFDKLFKKNNLKIIYF